MIRHLHKLPKSYRQFIKFCIVGTISLGVNVAAYAILTRVFGMYYLAADPTAYIIALINSYLMNRSFTFNNKHKKVGMQFIKYAIVYTVGMGLSVGLLYVFVEYAGLYDLIAKFLAIGVVTIWNFFGSKFLIFDRDEKKDHQAAQDSASN